MNPSSRPIVCIAFLLITLSSIASAVDQPCTSNVECSNDDNNSHCDEEKKVCVCDIGCEKDSKGKCVHRKIGSACTDVTDCEYVENGICNKGSCGCDEGYIGNKEGDACMMVNLGDACSTDVDCKNVGNATCQVTECDSKDGCKVCTCKYGFGQDDYSSCQELIEIGKECNEDDPRICGFFTNCNGTCICKDGYKKKDGEKYDCKGDLLEFCLTKNDCIDKYAACMLVSHSIPMPVCACPVEHPMDKDHCSAGSSIFSTFSIVGALMALVTMIAIS